ncbi:hypothetical protein Syun_002740 [Stephania yunnanensis]|uniref:Uncharacterized protein n=1 Tax=Stephania yunnanensis TaxID=152371 RepID=A0AAP0LGY6_9MAGN
MSQLSQFSLLFLLPISDFMVSFIWVCLGALNRLLVHRILGLGFDTGADTAKGLLSVGSMFLCAWLGKITGGGSYNPLALLPGAISGQFSWFVFTIAARVPVQVLGCIAAAKLITETFQRIGDGPCLNVEMHLGALTEGLLSFGIVVISMEATYITSDDFFMKTWISSVCKVALHLLGSDLTGGWMNPASAIGWTYMDGKFISEEHLLVYCLAPIQATLLAVWIFRLFVKPTEEEEIIKKKKTD